MKNANTDESRSSFRSCAIRACEIKGNYINLENIFYHLFK